MQRPRSFALPFVAFVLLGTSLHTHAQHGTCHTAPIGDGVVVNTICDQDNYVLPGNFDAALLHEQVEHIFIGSKNNVAYPAAVLPHRHLLTSLYLFNFNEQPNLPRFSMQNLLQHNRHQIVLLLLNHVKLVHLMARDFSGFNKLEYFFVTDGQLNQISVSTFAELGLGPAGEVLPKYVPKLKTLSLNENPDLRSFDWAFLAPLWNSLEKLELESNGFTGDSITRSKKFILTKALKIRLSAKLTHIPAAIYETLNPVLGSAGLKVNLLSNRFCSDRALKDCGCCEMAGFAGWLNEHYAWDAVEQIYCGNSSHPDSQPTNSKLTSVTVSLREPNLHSHCFE